MILVAVPKADYAEPAIEISVIIAVSRCCTREVIAAPVLFVITAPYIAL